MPKKKAPIVTVPFIVRYAGSSSDRRTNRWWITCCCGHSFEPPTTCLAGQNVTCPKCEYPEYINYNEI